MVLVGSYDIYYASVCNILIFFQILKFYLRMLEKIELPTVINIRLIVGTSHRTRLDCQRQFIYCFFLFKCWFNPPLRLTNIPNAFKSCITRFEICPVVPTARFQSIISECDRLSSILSNMTQKNPTNYWLLKINPDSFTIRKHRERSDIWFGTFNTKFQKGP